MQTGPVMSANLVVIPVAHECVSVAEPVYSESLPLFLLFLDSILPFVLTAIGVFYIAGLVYILLECL